MKTAKTKKPKVVLSTLEQAIKKIADPGTFRFGVVEYDYDRERHCSDYGCYDQGICRCSTIHNIRVTSVDIDYIVNTLTADCKDALLVYCIDRILRQYSIMNTDNWEVNVCRGYYGEETDGVILNSSVQSNIVVSLQGLFGLQPIDMIKKVLEYEYGYVLPRLEELNTVSIMEVDINSVNMANATYTHKVSKEAIDYYVDYKLPRAVCISSGNYHQVIDGYHRMLSAQKSKAKTVSIIELGE